MKSIVVVQARLGSTRLPNKVLAEISGKPMIQHVVERARAIKGMDDVIATIPREDVELLELLHSLGVACIYHEPPDVLGGYAAAMRAIGAHKILRITGDCPLIDPHLCHKVSYAAGLHSFATADTRRSGFPDGLDVEAFSSDLLFLCHHHAKDAYDREHVTSWMRRAFSEDTYPVISREPDEFSRIKLSVDAEEDLERVRRIMAHIPTGEYSWQATQTAMRQADVC